MVLGFPGMELSWLVPGAGCLLLLGSPGSSLLADMTLASLVEVSCVPAPRVTQQEPPRVVQVCWLFGSWGVGWDDAVLGSASAGSGSNSFFILTYQMSIVVPLHTNSSN